MTYSPITEQLAPRLADNHEYPRRWSEMIGQEPAKHFLQVAIKSAKKRKAPLDHILIAQSTGMGKTALANLVANAMNGECRVAAGAGLDVMKARLIFADMKDGDVLVVDEAHGLAKTKDKGEWMLNYLQDYMLPGPMGLEAMPKVTIIAATTEAGKLLETIVGRFIEPPMQGYTDEEATKVAITMSKRMLGDHELPALRKADAVQVAAAACNNPRAIHRLLVPLRDLVLADEFPVTASGRYDIPALLAYQGMTPDGLDRVAQRYLTVLTHEFQGKAGEKNLEDRLQSPGGLKTTERLLMDKGLIAKTRTGREITMDGVRRVRELQTGVAA